MKLLSILLLIFCIVGHARSQVRVGTLVVDKEHPFRLHPSDIIVADTLVMKDSATLMLNDLKNDNFLRIKVAIIGKHCKIRGEGMNGRTGRNGGRGTTSNGPCRDGSPGKNGSRGLDGGNGINLYLYVDKLVMKGDLLIALNGGHGGNGGDGGMGGSGSGGTVHCLGGNGGIGGSGGNGGNGGNGGRLTIGGADAFIIKSLIGNSIAINIKGGNFGYAGLAAEGGSAGLGPNRKNGKRGARGRDGVNGRSGDSGTIQFEQQ